MATVRGCEFPEHLYYDVPNQIWYEPLADGTIKAGFVPSAVDWAGDILMFTPKRAGLDFEKNKYFAMIETGKWVGAARAGFPGVVVKGNEKLIDNPSLANSDPYGEGWLVIVRASDPEWRRNLVTGAATGPAFERWMEREGYRPREK